MARVADQPRLNLHCRHAAARDALGVARGGDVALDDAKTHTGMQDARGLFQQGGLAAARRPNEVDGERPREVERGANLLGQGVVHLEHTFEDLHSHGHSPSIHSRRRSSPSVARTSSVAAPSTGPARRISNAKARASGTTPLRAPTQTPIFFNDTGPSQISTLSPYAALWPSRSR